MSKIVVGVGDMAISNQKEDVIVTYALGSCIAIVIYDPVALVGGILHYMLPESKLNKEKAKKSPYMFGDTGIPMFFKAAYEYGAKKERLVVKVAGGANILEDMNLFDVGKRNWLLARKLFWKNSISIKKHDVGGSLSRTVELSVKNGECRVKSEGCYVNLI